MLGLLGKRPVLVLLLLLFLILLFCNASHRLGQTRDHKFRPTGTSHVFCLYQQR